jgi:HD-GYP domain-containing protein (c-di-GMP phosphodiesterase class II)
LAIMRAAGRGRPPVPVVALIDSGAAAGPVLTAVQNVAFECFPSGAADAEIEQSVHEAVDDYESALGRRSTAPPARRLSPAAAGPRERADGVGEPMGAERPPPAGPVGLLNADSIEALMIVAPREAFRAIASFHPTGPLNTWFAAWPAEGEERVSHASRSSGVEPGEPPLQLARDAREASRALALPEDATSGALAGVPVRGDLAVLGVLLVRLPGGAQMTPGHTAALYSVADRVAATHRHLERMQERRRAVDGACEALLTALALRAPERAAHARRVVPLAAELGRELGIHGGSIEMLELERAALLCSIGSLAVPREFPAATAHDVAQRGEEQSAAYSILREVPSLEGVADVVHAAREQWDGGGEPRGLAGRNIPFPSRIIAVAEAWDDLVIGSGDRPPVSADRATTLVAADAGTRFDPWVIRAFERIAGRWATAERGERSA